MERGKMATLVTKGIPNGTEFGIDLQAYVVGDQFKGVKFIPAGLHCVYWSSRDSNGDLSIRNSFIHYFNEKEICVREWDDDKEELKTRKITDAEKQRIQNFLSDVEHYLVSYDHTFYEKWLKLTNKIHRNSTTRLNTLSGYIKPHSDMISDPNFDRSQYNSENIFNKTKRTNLDFLQDEDFQLPFLKPIKESTPNFTIIPERCPENSTPNEITKHYMDCIDAVDMLFDSFGNDTQEVLAEIQFSFLIFLTSYSIEGLLQWRKFLLLFSNSEFAVEKYSEFYKFYLEILTPQILELPEELIQLSPRNLVYRDLKQLILNLYNVESLKCFASKFRENIQAVYFDWFNDVSFYEIDPEDMPVIVEL